MKMSRSRSWRDLLTIHPAAALFPRMSSDELRELGEDIRKNGLRSSIALWQPDKGASVTGVANTEVTAAPSESSATVAARDDIGPGRAGEIARLNARIDELQAEKRQLEIKAVSLRSEIDELDSWVEDLYGELETILDRRNGIREQVAHLKLEETQA
jgi:hypothetical protein